MAVADGAARTRGSFERRMWGDAFAELSAARREGRLGPEDLERLAVAAYMVGSDDACQEAWLAAHHEWLGRGDTERAAQCAFWQALGLFFRGDLAPAMGWVTRGGRLLEERRRNSVAQAWLLMLTALPRLFEGDPEVGPSLVEAEKIAERLADADALTFARLGRGYSLILEGRVADGMAFLDEVMVSVTADEVAPMLAGIAYCQVITLCQAVFDLRRPAAAAHPQAPGPHRQHHQARRSASAGQPAGRRARRPRCHPAGQPDGAGAARDPGRSAVHRRYLAVPVLRLRRPVLRHRAHPARPCRRAARRRQLTREPLPRAQAAWTEQIA